jgi:N-acetylmuramoyl-L-alanine amidase
MTREGDQPVTLDERAAFANRERADIFVSIHVNWFEGVRESGIETYFLGVTDDPFLNRLAASENVESGHTLAEMRQLLEGIYAGVRRDKSENLAREIHGALFRSLRRVNPELADRGVKRAPFLVLVDTEMPAILAEVAALSSEAEAAMLEKPHYRAYIADSLAAGIVAYAESVGRPARHESFEARGAGGDGGDPIGQKGR